MPDQCSCKNLLTILVIIYIQKRIGEPGLFSYEYKHVTKVVNRCLPLHGSGKNLYSIAPRKNDLEKNSYLFYYR